MVLPFREASKIVEKLGFPIAVCFAILFAAWHFGQIFTKAHIDFVSETVANQRRQSEAIELMAAGFQKNSEWQRRIDEILQEFQRDLEPDGARRRD